MAKVIFHIDLNAFFASAEEVLDPSLKDKPVVVSGQSRRSVVSTANYIARQYGIHSAMPLQMAMDLCPDLVVVKGHYSFYEELSNRFIDEIKKITPLVEQASIDECYADMTEAIQHYEKPLDLAWKIQQNLYQNYHLKCSIGVAPNKFLAKMASDMKKPMGITVIRKQEVPLKLWPLNIKEMQGIGKKTAPLMNELGIMTIGDLANYQDIERLQKVLGKNTQNMIDKANGISSSEIVVSHEVKSLSQSTTFHTDISDYEEIAGIFKKLAENLSFRMKEEGKIGSLVSISIRYYDFNTIVRSKKLDYPIQSADDLYENAIALYDQNQSDQTIRHLGIGIAALKDANTQSVQISLFDLPKTTNDTLEIIDELNKKLSKKSLTVASSIKGKKNV